MTTRFFPRRKNILTFDKRILRVPSLSERFSTTSGQNLYKIKFEMALPFHKGNNNSFESKLVMFKMCFYINGNVITKKQYNKLR
jgi:hypothetical protein